MRIMVFKYCSKYIENNINKYVYHKGMRNGIIWALLVVFLSATTPGCGKVASSGLQPYPSGQSGQPTAEGEGEGGIAEGEGEGEGSQPDPCKPLYPGENVFTEPGITTICVGDYEGAYIVVEGSDTELHGEGVTLEALADEESDAPAAITITGGSYVLVRGFVVQGYSMGIDTKSETGYTETYLWDMNTGETETVAEGSMGLVLENNTLVGKGGRLPPQGSFMGIQIVDYGHVQILDNRVSDFYVGAGPSFGSMHVVFGGNTFEGNFVGISVTGEACVIGGDAEHHPDVKGNHFKDNSVAVRMMGGSLNYGGVGDNNTFEGNGTNFER